MAGADTDGTGRRSLGAWLVAEGIMSHLSGDDAEVARGGRVPPAVWGAAAFALQFSGERQPLTVTRAVAAVTSLGMAGWLGLGSVRRFYRESTTIDPRTFRPETLVTAGPNRVTRNPMYVAIAGVLVAHAIARGSTRALLPVAGFVAIIDRTQIRPEESALRARFGQAYERYAARTPRWLGLKSVRPLSVR